ncbi:CDP-alcohol phosphatidyltransferase family protein [candidate division WOR-3 bacterium]|uniref:CDP-alcohol phosphatidyltransferase family protein n=1 Tax=candidate division WOR-3 bacterium TaxID=2052148 RepID=A0A937XHZ9_UNCW3|nr:CDP-alcohol phosphatidyltransferase family protein [candidate division WOR-3 bacterium]
MNEKTKQQGRRLLRPLVSLLAAMDVSPTAVTVFALPLSIGAGGFFAVGQFMLGGVLVALVGLCDTLDGELSRRTGTSSALGAFIDSTVDRLSESFVLVGLYWFYRDSWYGLLAVVALVFSLMVSYVRARAEGVGRECKVGFFERPVRVLVLLFGAFILGRTWMPTALGVIALGSFVTVVHRTIHVLAQRSPAS